MLINLRLAQMKLLLKKYAHEDGGRFDVKFIEMRKYLINEDFDNFFDCIKFIFSGIPNIIIEKSENYFSSIISRLTF